MLCALQESRTHPDARVKHFKLSLVVLGTFCRGCVAWLLWEIQLADLADLADVQLARARVTECMCTYRQR